MSAVRQWLDGVLGIRARQGVPREDDVPVDPALANSRATGGDPDAVDSGIRYPDSHSTTGTTVSGEFVGRASGDDPGNIDIDFDRDVRGSDIDVRASDIDVRGSDTERRAQT